MFELGNSVMMINPTGYIVFDFKDMPGKVIKIAEKTSYPYQVKFKTGIRWCSEEELEISE